jgi:hypothetical protein
MSRFMRGLVACNNETSWRHERAATAPVTGATVGTFFPHRNECGDLGVNRRRCCHRLEEHAGAALVSTRPTATSWSTAISGGYFRTSAERLIFV